MLRRSEFSLEQDGSAVNKIIDMIWSQLSDKG